MKKLVLLSLVIISGFVVLVFFVNRLEQEKVNSSVRDALLKSVDQKNEITLVLGGDVMLGRSVSVEALDKQKNALYPFVEIKSLLESADLVFLNLENPIIANCPRHTGGFKFCAPVEMLAGLTLNKNTVVNLSNNHTLNYGREGIVETKDFLDKAGVKYVDNTQLLVQNINNTSFGFLGFDKSQQSNPTLNTQEQNLVKAAKEQVDVLIIALHWGIEYNAHPTTGQRKLAQALALLGADVVVGHHPHWVQDIEKVGEVPVYYSLGNLIFDQMWSEETKKGLMIKLTFENKRIINEEIMPTYMYKFAQPTLTSVVPQDKI